MNHTLVHELASTLKIVAGPAGSFEASVSWRRGLIDLPEACNRLARVLRVPSVTVVRRTSPMTECPKDGHRATLRFAGLTAQGAKSLARVLRLDPGRLANEIIKSRV